MKRIWIDFLKRRWWIYVIVFFLHALVTSSGWKDDVVILFAVLGGSGLLLFFDLNRGFNSVPRTLLSLPISKRRLTRVWKWIGLEFPFLLFLVALAAGRLLAELRGDVREGYSTWEYFVGVAVLQTVLLGIIFFCMTGFRSVRACGTTLESYYQALYGILIGFSLPGIMIMIHWIPKQWNEVGLVYLLVVLVLIGIAVAGWFRGDVLVDRRVGAVKSAGEKSGGSPSNAGDPGRWRRFGGFRYYLLNFWGSGAAIGFLILFINWFFLYFIGDLLEKESNRFETPSSLETSQIEIFAPVMALVVCFGTLSLLRAMRVLPISLARLSSYLVFGGFLFALLFGLAAMSIFCLVHRVGFEWDRLAEGCLGAAVMLLCVPVFLRFGFKLWSFGAMMLVMLGGIQGMQALLEKVEGLPLPIPHLLLVVPLAGGVMAIVWWLVYGVLRSPHPWRQGAMRMPFQQKSI